MASGYVYYVSLKGVTGAGHLDVVVGRAGDAAHPRRTSNCRSAWVSAYGMRPVPAAVAEVADAVVIGSRLVQILEAEPRDNVAAAGRRFMAEIRTALDTSDQGNRT